MAALRKIKLLIFALTYILISILQGQNALSGSGRPADVPAAASHHALLVSAETHPFGFNDPAR